jgi:hypothetical protein
VETPGNLGFSRYDFLVRDNEAHAPDPGDGYHSQRELRQVIQQEYDAYERSGRDPDKWEQYQYSKRMLDAMSNANVDTVDYMPDEFDDLPDELRPRAVELLNLSYDMRNGGKVDYTVLDRLRNRYSTRCSDGIITDRARDKAIGQINQIGDYLARRPA